MAFGFDTEPVMAFPYTWPQDTPGVFCKGMTLRDYFAAAALTGYRANRGISAHEGDVARWSYDQADAMLSARGE